MCSKFNGQEGSCIMWFPLKYDYLLLSVNYYSASILSTTNNIAWVNRIIQLLISICVNISIVTIISYINTMEGQSFRVSQKTVPTFVLWISRLPRGLEIPSWTFFNSPFCVDFKNVQFSIIWWNLHWDISKLLQGGHFKS